MFEIIYADPPWTYKDKATAGERGAEFNYPCMTIDDICRLPVKSLASPNATLFLWVTSPLLAEGFRVIDDWGFTYKTVAFVWVKQTKHLKLHWGMGNWTRANAELCLLGVKGKPKRVHKGIHQIVQSPVREHSRKPDEIRDKIVELMGDRPRIELFARQRIVGWSAWGNEICPTVRYDW